MLNIKSLRKGERVSLTQYLEVVSTNPNTETIEALMQDGTPITIRGKELVETMASNSQYEETRKVGKHDLASVLQRAGDKVFTVCYLKADKSERILTGYFVSAEPNLGRTQVIDLEVDPKDKTKGFRLIDNREVKWIVLNNVKYTSK
jgi:hypothetical protein